LYCKDVVKRILSILLILSVVIGTLPVYIKATDRSYTYYSDDGNLMVNMSNSIITITAISHAATSNTRWRTIGLNITKNKITSETTATRNNIVGPGSVSDAGRKYYLPYEGHVFSDKTKNGINTKIVQFDRELVESTLGEDFSLIEEGTTIYMHAVFETYDNSTNTIRQSSLQNWKSIMEAEGWGADTLSDFEKYYNMELQFMPAAQPTTIFYKSEDGVTLHEFAKLDVVLPNHTVYWTQEQAYESLVKNGKTYNLIGYYVTTKKDPSTKLTEHYLGNSGYENLRKIKIGNTTVKLGGMNVYLIYKYTPGPPPTPTPKVTPIPVPPGLTPTPRPSTTPIPTPTPIVVPQSETISATIEMPVTTGNIQADNRRSEKFTVNAGVPTTESLYTEVKSMQYLMGYQLKKQVGIETYPVTVTKNYILKWQGTDARGPKAMTSTVPVKKVVNIRRSYGYWEILNFDLYKINNAIITNYALPNGSTTMTPNYSAGYSPPSATTVHTSSKEGHLVIPTEITNGVELSPQTITGTTTKPSVPTEDFTVMADGRIPNLKVKNDSLILDGRVVMSDTPTEKEGPSINSTYLSGLIITGMTDCNENVLYKPGQIIEDIKKNGTYHSAGVITYTRVNSVSSNFNTNIENNIVNLSSVVIHTPVLCNPIVTADNDKYVQLLKPTSAVQLVLDPDSTLNDFTLFISNFGLHSYKQGYFTRDFSRSLRDTNVSYLASSNESLRNEVKFPFDIYLKQSSGNIFIKQNTWVVLGRNTATFYLPMWVIEGTYTVACRSIAVNADMSKLDEISEEKVNSKLFNYVAIDTFKVEVSGRIYGLSIYDLTDYPMWQEAFRVKNSLDLKINDLGKYLDGTNKTTYSKGYSYNYTVGTNDQYGNDTTRNVKYTFPLVNGSHPYYTNIGVLKTGYAVRFKLNTIGTMYGSGCSIKIKPTFYYVDANGKNRTAVDLYYEEEINGKNQKLVQMGSKLDKTNVKTMEAGLPYTGIPTTEMKDTAIILKMKYAKFIYSRDFIFTFKDIRISSTFRTFVNKDYTNTIAKSNQYAKIEAAGTTKDTMMKQMQSWYSSYYLPGIMHAVDPKDVPKGLTVFEYAQQKGISFKEDFWKTDGYIIVNFDIITIDSNGNERLSYINATNYLNNGNNCMWTMEGAPLSKKDHSNNTFNFRAGDFIMYYANKSIQDDYSPGGIY